MIQGYKDALNRCKYRAGFQQRFAGYQLYMSNTTDSSQDGVLCYEDTSSTRDAVQLNVIHQCPYVGRYVTVYNYRNNPKRYSWYDIYAILELCERGTCSVNCNSSGCIKDTGQCYDCVGGKYGVTCEMDCSGNCKDPICDRNTGYCSECVAGTYGSSCGQACSVNCKDRVCTKTTGHCIECVTGKFGNICEQDCSVNCKDRLCVKDSGYCTGMYNNIISFSFVL
ncbi:cell death abnormality protein 1-like [Argopecten irradians]|uniref:cell death abnormality protein 1-like n=1 Tax=Argopecten irradians TaxID=31199 RepID=UPI0037202153